MPKEIVKFEVTVQIEYHGKNKLIWKNLAKNMLRNTSSQGFTGCFKPIKVKVIKQNL